MVTHETPQFVPSIVHDTLEGLYQGIHPPLAYNQKLIQVSHNLIQKVVQNFMGPD